MNECVDAWNSGLTDPRVNFERGLLYHEVF